MVEASELLKGQAGNVLTGRGFMFEAYLTPFFRASVPLI
jgi:hypothetical protein